MELIFFLVAGMVLPFGFRMRIILVISPSFSVLLDSLYLNLMKRYENKKDGFDDMCQE